MVACQKTLEPDDKRLGYVYFPLEIGRYVIYNVEELTYRVPNNGIPQRRVYQLKEIVADTFTNLSGEKQFVLERYTRTSFETPWQIDSVWSALRTGSQAIKFENNVPYVKLVFPTENNKTWNGNAYNDKGEQTYRITDFRKPQTFGELSFPNTLKVNMGKDSSLVSHIQREEIFAENVGLIYLFRKNIRYFSDPPNLGLGKIESGKIEKFTIVDYGKE
ncbi:hypothetical protein [Raineya orbicola]|jgi:hypothetical protein|uniref:Uncharacterized protein n=1 Tax=Raineya orbicola TaxID=2016530 RepID=A0A2N3IIT9_9BACT|nr:hypothetical protein [Raineya orbicola]PKQ70143.1 hypothetical protein Rain11_0803 [Raineya orbicola]